ncbi:hypothetical protein GCM10022631_00940 [Deinococcus rubellus]
MRLAEIRLVKNDEHFIRARQLAGTQVIQRLGQAFGTQVGAGILVVAQATQPAFGMFGTGGRGRTTSDLPEMQTPKAKNTVPGA